MTIPDDVEKHPNYNDTINQGGLMRCCLQSWDEALTEAISMGTAEYGDGAVLTCKWCKTGVMIRENGRWRWDHE